MVSIAGELSLHDAFEIMKMCRSNLFFASEKELEAEQQVKLKEVSIINSMDPKELGSNDKARDARLKDLCQIEGKALKDASRKKREAQLAYELATMSADLLKWEIRQRESEKQ